jgi:hypothetical protein
VFYEVDNEARNDNAVETKYSMLASICANVPNR